MEYVKKIQIQEKERWTSKIIETAGRHKLITLIVTMFISFSVLNGVLIINFMRILSNMTYIH